MRHLILTVLIVLFLGVNTGCSVFMAAKQPDKKNLELMEKGIHRDQIIVEFGNPIQSEVQGGKKVEIYQFIQGYSTEAKSLRALFHAGADVVTLGLWEVVGTPVEGGFDGDEMAYKITFNEQDIVTDVVILKGTGPEPEDEPEPTEGEDDADPTTG